jgi:glycosyltransferase involved in cell wall biosynthesis
MTILYLTAHLNAGGITTYVMTLASQLIRQGHSVVWVSSGGDLQSTVEKLGIRHVMMNVRFKCEVHPCLLFNVPALAKLIRRENISVIHANTRATQMLAAGVSRLTGVPYVTTCHGYFKAHIGRRLLPLWGRRVIAISKPVHEHLRKDHHVATDKIRFVNNGIDLEVFKPVSGARRTELRQSWGVVDEPVLGVVARLSDVKGLNYLIDAMPKVLSRFPKVKCFIVGEGPMEAGLKEQVLRLGLSESVLFRPVVNKTADVLPVFDVFVLPSLSEGLGLSLMEAQAMALPVVASAVGGVLDIVKDKETGWLVPPKDPSALAEAIMHALSAPDAARRVGAKAREGIINSFSAEKMAELTLNVYKEVI